MATNEKQTIFDFERLAAAVTEAKEARHLQFKDVALQSGVDPAKLSNLTRHHASLSLDNTFMLCDWLGQKVDSYKRPNPPDWVVERRRRAAAVSDQEHAQRRETQERAIATAERAVQWISDGSMDELMAAAKAAQTEREHAPA